MIPKQDSSSQERREPSRGRRAILWTAALALPFLLLGVAELAMRIGSVAEPEPLFITEPRHPEYSFTNPNVIARFFPRRDLAPKVSVETGYFHTERPKDGIRLVVQGGSSAAGFPYGYGASLAGMLEQRLRRRHPDRSVEVITTAMAAVNTWALLDFADEIIELRPDAVLIYAGHNEFLGIFGVGSVYSASSSPVLTRWLMGLRHLRLYRVMERLLAPKTSQEAPGGTLMAKIARETRIPFDSPLFDRGVAQFRGNIGRLLSAYESAGIPVFIATLASNERDQPPFETTDPPADDADWNAARGRFEAGQWDSAADDLVALSDRYPHSGTVAWLTALALDRDGRAGEAARFFRKARDLDELRFRAPTIFNELIREASQREGVTLVDAYGRFAERSPGGAVGRDFMLEHLHPNLEGYFLLADAFYDQLVRGDLLPAGQDVPDAVAAAEIPLSEGERLFGEYKLERLLNDWPFTDTPREPELPVARTVPERLAQAHYRQEIDWASMQSRLRSFYRSQGDEMEYRRVATILADGFPFSDAAQLEAGELLIEQNRPLQALRYLHRAVRYGSRNRTRALLALSDAYARAGYPAQAIAVLDTLLEREPGHAEALRRRQALNHSD